MSRSLLFVLSFISLHVAAFPVPQDSAGIAEFKKFVNASLKNTSREIDDYPTPPEITDEIIAGMEKEWMHDDSARWYFARISMVNYKLNQDLFSAIDYFSKKDFIYTLLSLSVHWNADVRVKSLVALYDRVRIGVLVNDKKLKTGERERETQSAIAFLIYVLENTPHRISGNENATIHHYYIFNIAKNLDLLTGEHVFFGKTQNEFTFTEQQIANAMEQWKTHLK